MNELLIQHKRAASVMESIVSDIILAYCDGLVTIEEIKKYDFCLACEVYYNFINFYTEDSITLFEAKQFVESL